MRRIVVAVGTISIFSVIGLFYSVFAGSQRKTQSANSNPTASKAIPAQLALVERRAISHPIHATGQMRAKSQIDLGFLVGGQVDWIGVDVGAKVHRGQVLARLDETQISADAERAHAAEEQAQRDLSRARHLEESGALPATALEAAQTGHTIAAAQQRSADFALRHGTLTAPEDGVIDARLIERGQTIAPGQPAFRLSGKGKGAIIRANLTDRDVVGLAVGRVAQVRMDALGDDSYAARVSQIAPAASPLSGAFEVEIRLETSPRDAKSGMTAKIDIERNVSPGAIVPVSALVPGDLDGASVVVVRDGTAHRLPVHVLFIEGELAALKETFGDAREVATLGAGMLGEGSLVQVVRP